VISERCAIAESEQWSAYVDRALAVDDLARAEEHLSGCEDCRATINAIAGIKRRAQAAQIVPPQAVFESTKREMRRRRFPWGKVAGALLAASLLVAFELMRRESNRGTESVSTVDVATTQSLRHSLSTLDDAIATTEAELARNPDDKLLAQLLRDAQADKSRALSAAQELARRSQ
jgi:Predicted integral membrane protein